MSRAVVIGSGMGGLVSALLLLKNGWEVDVVEQHYRAGGFLHRFFREGAGYDTGFHYVGSAQRDQLFGRVLSHLGVYDRLRFVPLDPDDPERAPRGHADASARSASEEVAEAELQDAITRAIAALPDAQRMAVVLRRFEDMPYEDIAKVLGTTVPSVKSLLFRARADLKDRLKPFLGA